MAQVFSNNASSRLISDLLPADTSVTISPADADNFPLPDEGDDSSFAMLTIEDVSGNFEIVEMPSRIGNVLNIVRAKEGTSQLGFATGSRIEARLTAGSLGQFKQSSDQYELRGGVIDSDGLRLWHEQDPSTYQFFTLRYHTDDVFSVPVMSIDPPSGIVGLNVAFSVTAPDGQERSVVLGTAPGDAPVPSAGEVRLQVPGQIVFTPLDGNLFGDNLYQTWADTVEGGDPGRKMKWMASGTKPVRYAWICRDSVGNEVPNAMHEDGSLIIHGALHIVNKDLIDYPLSQGGSINSIASPFVPAIDDWMVYGSSVGADHSSRTFSHIFTTNYFVPGVEPLEPRTRRVGIVDGQVLIDYEPTLWKHAANKAYVDAQVASGGAAAASASSGSSYGRDEIFSSAGTADGSTQTLVPGAVFSDYGICLFICADGNRRFTQQLDMTSVVSIGTGTEWVLVGGPDGSPTVTFHYLSDTQFKITASGSGAALVTILGLFPT